MVQAGKLRLLAVFTDKRAPIVPNAPTIKELGFQTVHLSPFGVFGPKNMPADVLKTLHDGFKKALDDPGFVKVMSNYGMPILYQNSADFAEFWAEAYKEAQVQVNRFLE